MEPSSSQTQLRVGIFVGIGLLAAMVVVLLLGGDRFLFKKQVEFRVVFSEVQGLFPGSVVSLSGLNVGNIKSIDMNDQMKLVLTLAVDPKHARRIHEGAIAEIRTQGALGDKFIYIKPGPPEAATLPAGSELPGEETDFMRLLTDRKDGMARVVDLVKEAHILITSLNQNGQLPRTMANLAESSEKLKSTLKSLDETLKSVNGDKPEDKKLQKAISSLSSVIEKIDRGQGTLGQLINDPSLHLALKNYLGASPRGRLLKDLARETIQSQDTPNK